MPVDRSMVLVTSTHDSISIHHTFVAESHGTDPTARVADQPLSGRGVRTGPIGSWYPTSASVPPTGSCRSEITASPASSIAFAMPPRPTGGSRPPASVRFL